jgi:hypothetical protein
MPLQYKITYHAVNTYDAGANGALWQFLITPETNDSQYLVSAKFENSENLFLEQSINGYGFPTFKVNTRQMVKQISFTAEFLVLKEEINPFQGIPVNTSAKEYQIIESLDFKVDFEQFLRVTALTCLPVAYKNYFVFDTSLSIFENLQSLNEKVFKSINFSSGLTHTETTIEEILKLKSGVCQDFAHLFCALARENNLPTRYVSGYLHQGNGFFGDLQMHAWVESYIPNIGWIGFDPTNNILADHHHIKVCHGKNYNDCAPLKGIVYTTGSNETEYKVTVASQQQQ